MFPCVIKSLSLVLNFETKPIDGFVFLLNLYFVFI